ncbi:uncharacterized protein B0H18DRAFT_52192 [Fomitopsis serialis]|uniref:uncharacterized protein n=1 Tax=Fomitopsis serialis TaxID=139415 RepID=UPI002007E5ED|nr:uncharacterized protein B0H18DRAFT_52192 [Neoantrodia serialis]KAH9932270.1 hypothetical protein B0H18DRAFT_52192 [Neoantrodia serialis]
MHLVLRQYQSTVRIPSANITKIPGHSSASVRLQVGSSTRIARLATTQSVHPTHTAWSTPSLPFPLRNEQRRDMSSDAPSAARDKNATDKPKHQNRLMNAKSPYLLQHAENPVAGMSGGRKRSRRRSGRTNLSSCRSDTQPVTVGRSAITLETWMDRT